MRRPSKVDCRSCESRAQSAFCQLQNAALARVNHEKTVALYRRGQPLFMEGTSVFGLYSVHSGKVKITKTGSDGKETIIRIASAGNFIGHRSLFSESPYQASAVALEDTVVCFIEKRLVLELLRDDPQVAVSMINNVSVALGTAESRIASMAHKNTRERFAEMLLALKRSYGALLDDGGVRLNIRLTREEMAAMIGSTSESLTRLITEFKKEGILSEKKKVLCIHDEVRLEAYADMAL